MDHPLRWTIFCFLIYLTLKDDKVICQFTNPAEGCMPSMADLISTLSKELSSSGKNQLMNTLLTIAANNGILPDLTSLLPSSSPYDNCGTPPTTTTPQTVNIIPLVTNVPTVCRTDPTQAPPTISNIPNPNLNSILSIEPQQVFVPEYKTQNSLPQTVQVSLIDNCYNSAQVPSSQPSLNDIIYSMYSPVNVLSDNCYQINPYPSPSPITPPSSCSSSSPLPQQPPASSAAPMPSPTPPQAPSTQPNVSTPAGGVEIITTTLGSQSNPFTSIFTSDADQSLPVNLEINIPAPNVPEPRITIVATERPAPYPIVKNKSTSLKKMLPLLLLAILSNDRNTCCCCNGPNYVPIPYPIPIPMGGAVMCPYCSNCDYDDEDEDKKKINRKRREDMDAWDAQIE